MFVLRAKAQGITWTMESASSAKGMRPEKPAAVYPYVTFAISLRPNWRAFRMRCRTCVYMERLSRGWPTL